MADERQPREVMIGEMSRSYAVALLAGDEVAAEAAVRKAMDAGLGTAEIDDGIIAPALWLVGDLWERGEISIADEHLATEISTRVVTLQREAVRVAGGRRDHRVMLATPAGEHHVVALRMLDALLREGGYDVLMLGPDVPPNVLADIASRYEPDAICLSSTMAGGSDALFAAIDEIRRRLPQTGFLVGGRGVAARMRPLPGVDVAAHVSGAVDAVDALVQRAHMN